MYGQDQVFGKLNKELTFLKKRFQQLPVMRFNNDPVTNLQITIK